MTDGPHPMTLAPGAPMSAWQAYVHDLEAMHGWLQADLVRNCFLMGEEVGELFRAVRDAEPGLAANDLQARQAALTVAQANVGEEIVDVLNYLLAIANRLDIDVEAAFREKNARNQLRRW